MSVWATSRRAGLRRWLGVIVVLVFGFRALIPPGYMLSATAGHTQLVMCPAGIHYAAGMHSMPGMAHAPGMDHGAHASLGTAQCPFALAAGAALLGSAKALGEPKFVTLQPTPERAPASIPVAPPSRYHAPRGPPVLA